MQQSQSLLLTVEEAVAKLGGIKRSTFYGMLRRGEIESVLVGRRRLIKAQKLCEFVERLGVREADAA